MRSRPIARDLALVILSLVVFGCGGQSTSEPTGSAAVRLTVSQVPAGVTSIRLTVTGEGLTPIQTQIPVATGFTTIEVPPRLLTFAVAVEARGQVFSGQTTQRIEGGGTNLVVVRITVNAPPIVTARCDPSPVGVPTRCQCSATDPDGDVLRFSWSVDGGSLSTTSGPTTDLTPAAPGASVTCLVSDGTTTASATASPTVVVSVPLVALTVTATTSSGGGSITSSPPGISCTPAIGAPCSSSASFPVGTTVVLAATGPLFFPWGGACASSGFSATCTLTLTASTTASRNF